MDWARQSSSSYSENFKNGENGKKQNSEAYQDPRSWQAQEEERQRYREFYKQNQDFEEKLNQFYNRKTGFKNVKKYQFFTFRIGGIGRLTISTMIQK